MRSCEQFELLASLAADGEASPEELEKLAGHLEACPDCRAYFEDIKRIHATFAREEVMVPEGFSARVMERVRETEQDRPEKGGKTVRFPRWKRWSALAACCALAALSLWAARSAGGVKNATVAMDAAPPASMQAQSTAGNPEEAEGSSLEDGEAAPASVPEEAPPPMPEEYEDLAKSAAKQGEGEGGYQPLINPQSDAEPALAASLPADNASDYARNSREELPASDDAKQEQTDAPPSGGEDEPAADNTLADLEPDLPAAVPGPEEEPEPAGESAPESEEPLAVAPVEVVGVPDPGILIAAGSAVKTWVEDTLGLEWAAGGSYPLSAEQYGDLLQVLEEAGEPYRIESGEGYCLMTE